MKKLLLLFFLSACFLGVNAQGGETPITTWNLSGNAGTSSRNFLGTTDTVPLIFRTTGIERMRITADGKIGIGTYQPQAKLHIEDENIVIYKSTPNNYFNPKGALLFTTEISNIQTGTWVVDYLTDNTNCGLNFWHRSQYNLANWNFYSHLFLGDTGNVGIGTFTPTAKLDVVGAIKATDATFSGTLTTTNLNFTGNLGLGTNRPKQKLHIENGNLLMKRTVPQAPGTLNGAIIFDANHVEQGYYKKWGIEYVNSVTDGYGLNFWRSDSAVGIPQKITNYSSVLFFDNGGSVGIGKNNPTAALDVGGSFKAQSAHITGKTYLDGDVGIGTNKPKQKLHVVDGNILISKTSSKDPDAPGSANGSILFGANIDNSSSMGRWGIEYLNGEDEVYGLNFWRPWNSSGGGYFNYGLFLTDDGKVGVGKKDPQTKLDVAGALKATSATITGDTYLGGNVGVGVTAPNTIFTKFQIGDIWTFHDGSANKIIGRNSYWDGGKYVRIKQGFASQLSFSSDGDIVLQTAPDGIANSTISSWNTVSFKNNGDVAIGTPSQQAKLEVSGALSAKSANINGNVTIKEGAFNLSIGSATGQNLSYGTSYIGFNAIRNNGSWAFAGDGANNGGGVIWSTIHGNINFASIPSTGTGAKILTDNDIKNNIKLQLTADGILKTKKLQVTTTNWPDYVFGKDYELLPLSEVAQYIEQNNCLPNIPSAREVIENGLDIGEMQSKLLQKIEELTLYIIEQEKLMKELEKRLFELESKKGGE